MLGPTLGTTQYSLRGWPSKNKAGVQDQSRRPKKGVIMKYINKCRGLLIYGILLTVVFKIVHRQKKSQVNTENSHNIEKTTSQQCIEIEFVKEIVQLVPDGLLHKEEGI